MKSRAHYTYLRIMSTASSYGKPSSISAKATITGALQQAWCNYIYLLTYYLRQEPYVITRCLSVGLLSRLHKTLQADVAEIFWKG